MSRFVNDRVKYGLIGSVRIYIDMRFISFDWIKADTVAMLAPRPFVGLPEDKFVRCPLSIFKF